MPASVELPHCSPGTNALRSSRASCKKYAIPPKRPMFFSMTWAAPRRWTLDFSDTWRRTWTGSLDHQFGFLVLLRLSPALSFHALNCHALQFLITVAFGVGSSMQRLRRSSKIAPSQHTPWTLPHLWIYG